MTIFADLLGLTDNQGKYLIKLFDVHMIEGLEQMVILCQNKFRNEFLVSYINFI